MYVPKCFHEYVIKRLKQMYKKDNKETQAEQLPQDAVKSSVCIELKDCDYECAYGCCTTFGTKLLLNGKELGYKVTFV